MGEIRDFVGNPLFLQMHDAMMADALYGDVLTLTDIRKTS